MSIPAKDRVGQTYHGLTVVSTFKKGTRAYVECSCVCGSISNKRLESVVSGKVRYCGDKCTRLHNNTLQLGSSNPCFRGVGQIGSCKFKDIKRNAERRGIEFNLTIQYISELFDKQNGICALSGMEIEFGRVRTSGTTASLDRIDSTKGYIEGNVQWVHKLVNRMKMDITEDVFLQLCEKITTHRRKVV